MIHTTSLLSDGLADVSFLRFSSPSVLAAFGNKLAVPGGFLLFHTVTVLDGKIYFERKFFFLLRESIRNISEEPGYIVVEKADPQDVQLASALLPGLGSCKIRQLWCAVNPGDILELA